MSDELLTPAQMAQADRFAIESGTPGIELMEAAGNALFEASLPFARRGGPILCLCGPGNNGGDGLVAARRFREAGFEAKAALACPAERLKGDALIAFRRFGEEAEALDRIKPQECALAIDALFGAGLDRDIEGKEKQAIEKLDSCPTPTVSADLPSGIHAESGQVLGIAARAERTVTFFRKKPGHLLYPGRAHCGEILLAQIGIDEKALDGIAPRLRENNPGLWASLLPQPEPQGHKYRRGHALIVSGGIANTGAARLAAKAALRSGAGLVTMASPPDALAVNAAHLSAVMLRKMNGAKGLEAMLEESRFESVLLGPAMGKGPRARELVLAALRSRGKCVLDADALTAFEGNPQILFNAIRKRGAGGGSASVALTPHSGEFARLFPNLQDEAGAEKGKVRRTIEAASQSGAVIIHKGADSVIASPDGRAVINANAPPWLATAGAGDALAGIAAGMIAQGMDCFEAVCASAWVHAEAARAFGEGLIAEDIEARLPEAFASARLGGAGHHLAPE